MKNPNCAIRMPYLILRKSVLVSMISPMSGEFRRTQNPMRIDCAKAGSKRKKKKQKADRALLKREIVAASI